MRETRLFMKRVFYVSRGKNRLACCRQTLARLCLECTPKGYPPPRRRQAVFRPTASPPWCALALLASALAGWRILAAASQSEVVTSSSGAITMEGRLGTGAKGEAGSAGVVAGAAAAGAARGTSSLTRGIVGRGRDAGAWRGGTHECFYF